MLIQRRNPFWLVIAGLLVIALVITAVIFARQTNPGNSEPAAFDGDRAFADVEKQMTFGPRTPGSTAHRMVIEYIQSEVAAAGWQSEVQELLIEGQTVQNVVVYRRQTSGDQPWVVVGAHYDSRMVAEYDPDPIKQQQPTPGANDGASGVGVLLELARVLPDTNANIWLVFFDAEDQGNLPGWDWILGSRAFVDNLIELPDRVLVVDMIGDQDLTIYMERNSNPQINQEIWGIAQELGYANYFIAEPGYSIIDDHTPFLAAGIPAADLIDFDYAHWHTSQDTSDKVAIQSLQVVGDVVMAWLIQQ